MAIGIVATLEIKPGSNADFEAIFKELAAEVRANEPATDFMSCTKHATAKPPTWYSSSTMIKRQSTRTTSPSTSSGLAARWALTWPAGPASRC